MTNNRIVSNLFWAVSGKIVTLAGSLFVGIVIARYLGPEQYGLMNYVISYVFLFQVFATFGLDNIEIRELARMPENKDQLLGTAFLIKITFALIAIAASIVTAVVTESDTTTILLIAVYSFSMIANSFNVMRNYFTAIVENKYIAKSEMSRTLIGACIKIGLLLMQCSLIWFIAASVFDVILLAAGYTVAYRSRVGSLTKWKFEKETARFLLKESFPLLLTSAAVIVYQRIDQVMIGQMVDKQSVGFFSVATRIVEILIYVPTIAIQTITPILVEARAKDEADYREKAQLLMNSAVWVTFAMSAITAILSYWIVMLLFGEAYLPAVAVLQILSFKATSVALSSTAGHMLIVEGIQKWAIFRDSMGCVVCIGLNYLLLPHYGAVAAAIVAITSNVVAGYLADAFIPAYRHLFIMQTKTLLIGWKDIGLICRIKRR